MIFIHYFFTKINQYNRMKYNYALRHQNYQSCLIRELAFYFFFALAYFKEKFPCFYTNLD